MQAAFFVGIPLMASVAKLAVAELRVKKLNAYLCLEDFSSSP